MVKHFNGSSAGRKFKAIHLFVDINGRPSSNKVISRVNNKRRAHLLGPFAAFGLCIWNRDTPAPVCSGDCTKSPRPGACWPSRRSWIPASGPYGRPSERHT